MPSGPIIDSRGIAFSPNGLALIVDPADTAWSANGNPASWCGCPELVRTAATGPTKGVSAAFSGIAEFCPDACFGSQKLRPGKDLNGRTVCLTTPSCACTCYLQGFADGCGVLSYAESDCTGTPCKLKTLDFGTLGPDPVDYSHLSFSWYKLFLELVDATTTPHTYRFSAWRAIRIDDSSASHQAAPDQYSCVFHSGTFTWDMLSPKTLSSTLPGTQACDGDFVALACDDPSGAGSGRLILSADDSDGNRFSRRYGGVSAHGGSVTLTPISCDDPTPCESAEADGGGPCANPEGDCDPPDTSGYPPIGPTGGTPTPTPPSWPPWYPPYIPTPPPDNYKILKCSDLSDSGYTITTAHAAGLIGKTYQGGDGHCYVISNAAATGALSDVGTPSPTLDDCSYCRYVRAELCPDQGVSGVLPTYHVYVRESAVDAGAAAMKTGFAYQHFCWHIPASPDVVDPADVPGGSPLREDAPDIFGCDTCCIDFTLGAVDLGATFGGDYSAVPAPQVDLTPLDSCGEDPVGPNPGLVSTHGEDDRYFYDFEWTVRIEYVEVNSLTHTGYWLMSVSSGGNDYWRGYKGGDDPYGNYRVDCNLYPTDCPTLHNFDIKTMTATAPP